MNFVFTILYLKFLICYFNLNFKFVKKKLINLINDKLFLLIYYFCQNKLFLYKKN